MKILITGGTGFVGCRMARFLGLSHEVVALSSRDLDITDREAVLNTFVHHSPKAVIHLAAISDTTYCEREPDDSALINVEGAVHVAEAAAAIGAHLVFASSEQVYNGEPDGKPNREDKSLSPKTIYGQHKLAAESKVIGAHARAVVLRLNWMYDLPSSPLFQRSGLLVNIVAADREGRSLRVSTREHRGITNVWEVVRRIEAALNLPAGIYNFGSPNPLSTFDIQLAAAQHLFEQDLIQTPPAQLILPDEQWTRNLDIDLSRLERFGITFPSTLTGLHNAFHARQQGRAQTPPSQA